MAIGWLTVLQSVPWSEVISNAPKVAEGAKKLWNSVSKKPAVQEAPNASAQANASSESKAIALLESRVGVLETEVADLHAQMMASSELLKALADQNAQLIKRMETYRIRVVWLACVVAALAFATGFLMFHVLMPA